MVSYFLFPLLAGITNLALFVLQLQIMLYLLYKVKVKSLNRSMLQGIR